MIDSLSILIPCYNGHCLELVRSLCAQAEETVRLHPQFQYEILVGDDGSTDKSIMEENRGMNLLPHCRYVERGKNAGRAAIRNFLAREARHEWLLFMDCDMVVRDTSYLRRYVEGRQEADVTYGGYVVNAPAQGEPQRNLRYLYESQYSGNSNASARQKHPYRNFHTSNFLVRRTMMLAHPLDERFRRYGYEDVLWGKTLCEQGIPIAHISNPLSFEKFETNADFVAKTEEGLATLAQFREELKGYSSLANLAQRLESWHLAPLVRIFHKATGEAIRRNLTSTNPQVWLLSIYKLGTFCTKVRQ